ncbi:extracellular solute-binding protein [Halocynthiibacter styelae]|uniref:ABC transporter substrate-binding protein n=1 Tax=Halocynthiibacter styelae TaxID=2761955 RepID=A0A8J7IRT2_9RHOB|nr:extracellular solute-binding protein [Paenihalocynthiibacter styelae]MBI1494331.1 ABC transporter substrate-binding protein [Paenihalocynthiibacter styelae]
MNAKIATRALKQDGNKLLGFAFATLAMAALALPAKSEDVITSHGISTFGNLALPADYTHLPYVNPEAPKGGEISIWGFGSFDSMNPYSTKGRAGGLANIGLESLLTSTADEQGASYGLLAESLEYPEDRSWVIFNMRPEARFADGSTVTAEDVVFTYETFVTKGLPSYRAVLSQQVASAEVLDTHRVKFTFHEGIPTRDLPQTVGGLPVFSKAHYEAEGLDLEESSLTPLLGSGSYELDELDVGQSITYRRRADYWGADLPMNIGRNNFDHIRVEYYADYQAAFEGFKGGSYTFRNEASSRIWATGYDFPAMDRAWINKVSLPNGDMGQAQSFNFNMRQEPFEDQRVREAIGMMFNFEWSNETLFYGLYERVNSFWENSDREATGLPSEAELALLEPLAEHLPDGVLDQEAALAPASGTRQLDRRNLRAASRLLDDAGWTVDDRGMRRNAAGELLTIEFLNDSPSFDRILNPYLENLRALGVNAEYNRVDNAQATDRERKHDYDFITYSYPMSWFPSDNLKQFFGSETAMTSVFNKSGIHSPAIDALIGHITRAQTEEELVTAVRALDRVLRAEKFWVPQWYKDSHTVAYYDMYEHPDPLPPFDLGYLDFWWFNADRAAELEAAGAFQ